ncbi:CbiX/SirB N-terminal domain-containing protein [Sedimentitalea sp. HM32M-2]|uniref:CbiX/SirB N-terminal domain-containing protein n=1 Tax=Sedimentitalea sp. HM32M-2 TaxID=3351566 RepID=UPI0036324B65
MSGTRSPFRRAQAINRRAVIVSHGQPSEPGPPEAALADLTEQVAALMPGWTLDSATLAAPGALAAAVERAGPKPLIYPLFMTDGWFTRTTLPDRLGDTGGPILAPLGTDPALPDLARDWLAVELRQRGWTMAETCLIVASHGSGKSRNSARDTERFVAALAERTGFAEIRTGYIEEPPFLGDVVFDTGDLAICLPFFAAGGGHVVEDIPEALDLAEFPGLRLPPIGTHAGVPALIAAALQAAAQSGVAA